MLKIRYQTAVKKDFERIKERIELLEILAEAEEDVRCGRVAPIGETFFDLRLMLKDR